MTRQAYSSRILILWTIVIVFISQLFHCAYTNHQREPASGGGSNSRAGANQQHQHQNPLLHYHQQPQLRPPLRHYNYQEQSQQQQRARQLEADRLVQVVGRDDQLLGSGSSQLLSEQQQDTLGLSGLEETPAPQLQQPQLSARDRCRELISLTLLSFRDLAPDERSSDDLDCSQLREQIAAAARSNQQLQRQQLQQQQRARQLHVRPAQVNSEESSGGGGGGQEQPVEEAAQPVFGSGRQNSRQPSPRPQMEPLPSSFNTTTTTSWTPKTSYLSQHQLQLQQLLAERQRRIQLQLQLKKLQEEELLEATTTAPTTTMATTFESLFETTLAPTTTSSTTTTSTERPKIKIGGRRPRPGKATNQGRGFKSSTSTTTTTTTTPRPSTAADYVDSSDVSTDYYDEYDDGQTQQTTTTTTTQRPHRKQGGRRQKRPRTTSTSPKPSTTTTTLSPGYQPRPDGRIIDYMADPNFPRELKGADLTNYPFYISVPEKIDFECKGRHDGYYTNIDLHCQIYHHCAVGNRYDFLCPNYTLFDQTTFTCRFINTVDCEGSTKHFDRNNALYVEKDEAGKQPQESSSSSTTTTTSTTTSTTTTQAPRLSLQLSQKKNKELQVSALQLMKQQRAATATGDPNR